MGEENRARLRQWLESGEIRLQPLAFPQRELWESSAVPVADPANHICGFIEIKGAITPRECEVAIQRVVDRQEALRISFLPGREGPLQLIRSAGATVFGFRELSPSEARPEALEALMSEIHRIPFDMMQGPLHRVEMVRRAANDYVLAFSIHHAIADGWSLGVFVQDLCTAYVMGLSGLSKAAAVGAMGLPDELPPVPQTYTQWAAGERSFWNAAHLAECATFWKSRLEGSRRLWSTSARGGVRAGPLERLVSAVPGDLTRGVRDLALRTRTTLFSTLLAAFQFTLSRWTGHDDVLVGAPVANRNREATRQTMGYFAGVVPLRSHVDRTRTVSDQLRTVHEMTVDCFANAMPFAELAGALGQAGSSGEHPVFDVRFALQNHPTPDVVLPRLSTKLRMRSTGTARFHLGCEITEIESALEVVWLFRPDMFPASSITELDVLFRAVLTDVCRNPEFRIAALTS